MELTQSLVAVVLVACAAMVTAGPSIVVRADRTVGHVGRLLTGACLEDVNHEVYGGLYSQMLFGESFQEPALPVPIEGFDRPEGSWTITDGVVQGPAGPGMKLVRSGGAFLDGSASVEVRFDDAGGGNAGLILRTSSARSGSDAFLGYEVSLDPQAQVVRLGRHRNDWHHFGDVPCPVPVGKWIVLAAELRGGQVVVSVDGVERMRLTDPDPLGGGTVGLRCWQRGASFRNLRVGGDTIALRRVPGAEQAVSGMWRACGTAAGRYSLVHESPFVGGHSQRLGASGSVGTVGIENRGLNRWGLHLKEGKPYDGVVWMRSPDPVTVRVALETSDGKVLAQRDLVVKGSDWRRYAFRLSPSATVDGGRFAIYLAGEGVVDLGYARLEPGAWGRLPGLPVRRDVAEGLKRQGITVLRYGGSMINHEQYRWKKMVGLRDLRPPHVGTWYPWSTNGWGIVDFLAFCRKMGVAAIPAFNMGESPSDMADFVEYATGADATDWGSRRRADGYGGAFDLRYIELGNEERIDGVYADRFERLANAIWDRDPSIILVVGDFLYQDPIMDPDHITGAFSGISSLHAHRRILDLARRRGCEVWFDVHVGTEGPEPSRELAALRSYVDAIDRLANGARHKVAVFEFNAGNHAQRRAVANAEAINECMRLGERLAVATSANCLQPDGQNDNDWNQGLLFLNPAGVWLQPPGYVTRMYADAYGPDLLECAADGLPLSVAATRNPADRSISVRVVNRTGQAVETELEVTGAPMGSSLARVTTLAAGAGAVNTAQDPCRVVPATRTWTWRRKGAPCRLILDPYSVTVVRLR